MYESVYCTNLSTVTLYQRHAKTHDTGYLHDGRADKDSYPHDCCAEKDFVGKTVVMIRILIGTTGIANTLC